MRQRAAMGVVLGLVLGFASVSATAAVGLARLTVGDLPVTLVYPTEAAEAPLAIGPFSLSVALDAPPTPGMRRLIVMSHGTGGSAVSDHALAATLARAGFVVAQPEHAGDNFQDTSRAGPPSWMTRPVEVSRVIDALASHPAWGLRLQLDRVGVHGMSAGGMTALSLAGAQWRLLDLVRHCLAHADEDPGFCFTGLQSAQAQAERRASFERARGVADGFLPAELRVVHGGRSPADSADPRPDPRVAAITLAVPLAAVFSAESLARIRVPVGVVRAGRDRWLQPAFHTDHVLRNCSRCTLLADLPGAGHTDLLAPWPEAVARGVAAQQPWGGSPEVGFDGRERDAAFQKIAEFFDRQLRP